MITHVSKQPLFTLLCCEIEIYISSCRLKVALLSNNYKNLFSFIQQ